MEVPPRTRSNRIGANKYSRYAALYFALHSKLKTGGASTLGSSGFKIHRHIFLQLGQFEKNANENPKIHIANKVFVSGKSTVG